MRVWQRDGKTPPKVETAFLDRAETAALAARCRTERTTVHGAISAALAVVLTEATGEPGISLYSPVNMRRHLTCYTQVSNMMFGGFQKQIGTSGEFWSLARDAVAGMPSACSLSNFAQNTAALEELVPAHAPSSTAERVLGAGLGQHMLSNLGRVSLGSDETQLRIRAVWGPACTTHLVDYQFVGVVTYGGVLRLINTTYHPVPDLLPSVTRRLVSCCT